MMASYVDLIGRIEAQIRTFRIAWMFRVINQRHAATPLAVSPLTQHADFWNALNDYGITLAIP